MFLTNLTEINLSKNLFSSSAHHEAHYKNPSYIGYLNQTREKKTPPPQRSIMSSSTLKILHTKYGQKFEFLDVAQSRQKGDNWER